MNIIRIEQYDLCVPFLRSFQTSYGQTTVKKAHKDHIARSE